MKRNIPDVGNVVDESKNSMKNQQEELILQQSWFKF